MRHLIHRSILGIAVLALLAPAASLLASGGSPAPSQPMPANPVQPPTPEEMARDHYNNGLRMRDHAWKLEEKRDATDDAAKREKLDGKVEKLFESAVREYKSAVASNPRMFQAWSSLGYALRRLGDYQESLSAYDKALEIEPGYTEAIEYRAEACLGLGQLDPAKDAYMVLFTHDRARSEELLEAMQAWVKTHREEPGSGMSASAVEEFALWVEQRGEVAAKTSAIYPSAPVVARAWK